MNFTDNNYLSHYGIKGMRWGVRRYQNVDGTRTEVGKARYRSGTAKTGGDMTSGGGYSPNEDPTMEALSGYSSTIEKAERELELRLETRRDLESELEGFTVNSPADAKRLKDLKQMLAIVNKDIDRCHRTIKQYQEAAKDERTRKAKADARAAAHYMSFMEQEYLCHSGINGTKWGLRCCQKPRRKYDI